MNILRVNIPGNEYDIIIKKGILDCAGEQISKIFSGKKIIIVTDSNVGPIYAKRLEESLKNCGFSTSVITIPAGEQSKSLDVLQKLYSGLIEFGITRGDLLVALGGGVVGDLAGFCASTYLRGIPFVQIPTTLLAQVDSSVGGKVAVNLMEGKNLIGAFYQPKLVLIDPDCLLTLDEKIFADGMAEVIKYGAIADIKLFEALESIENKEDLFLKIPKIIYNCCDIKRKITEKDEKDTGERMLLNFGHTFGHAIEKKYNYKDYTHGMGVAVGMVMASEWGEEHNITQKGVAERLEKILKKYKLPTKADIDREELLSAVAVDKKGLGNKIRLILIENIGKSLICEIEKSNI